MSRFRTLRSRLALSHVLVVLGIAITVLVVGRLTAPAFYRDHIGMMAGMMGGDALASDLQEATIRALNQALVVSVGVGLFVALVAAWFASRRLIEPIDDVRRATRKLAEGNYGERVALPAEAELAGLASDVNRLADSLATTEQRRMRLLTDFAHEFRTPLATVEGYMEALLDGVLEPSPEIFGSIALEASRMKRLADDLGLLSRTEEGVVGLRFAPVDIGELATSVAARLDSQFVDKGVSIHLAGGPKTVVLGDADRLVQVLTNLIGNALSYTQPGGHVSVSWGEKDEVAIVTVEDDGKGIAPEALDMVFERFYRVDRSVPGGTGVGLTIARSIARLHGGDIVVHSSGPGQGSRFEVSLPVAS